MYIVGKVHVEAIEASLRRASLNANRDDSRGGILRAALIGNTNAVCVFLDSGFCVNERDAGGRTPLMEAVFGGHLDTVEELLKRGADVNTQDRDGWTALMEACSKGRADVVRTLLGHGADPGIKNKNGWTALRTTAKCNIDVTRLLRHAGVG